MIAAVVNHLWQSTVFVLAMAVVALALRRNHASVRYVVWLAASLKFLLPFSVLIGLGASLTWPTTAPIATFTPAIVETVQTVTEPFAAPTPTALVVRSTPAPSPIPWAEVLASVWAAGCVTVVILRVRGWRHVSAALRAGTPVSLPSVDPRLRVRATTGLIEPGVVGLWRPVLLVPVGLEGALSPDQLRAVVLHEVAHVRRRDNLTSALHMAVEAVFWFHPLVWWVGTRLVDERERACDEFVIASGAAAEAYAEGILTVCKRYVESPVACVAGVTGSDLKKRIVAILSRRVGVRLSLTQRLGLAAVAAAGLTIPVAAGLALGSAPAHQGEALTGSQGRRFEAAAIRPCDRSTIPTGRGGHGPGSSVLATDRNQAAESPGHLFLHCFTAERLIQQAYFGRISPHLPMGGGPAWIRADEFDIEAVAAADALDAEMRGPMLRSLLEERFHLRTRRETRVRPIYELRTAKDGFKLTALPEGTCAPQIGAPSSTARCGFMSNRYTPDERTMATKGQTVGQFAQFLEDYAPLDRPVIDRTSIIGVFDFQVEFPADGTPYQAIGAALPREVGLTLGASTGPADFVLIDQIEKPVGDQATPSATQPPAAVSASAGPQKFEVASVRPCESKASPPRSGGAGLEAPDYLYLSCLTLRQLVRAAYAGPDTPLRNRHGGEDYVLDAPKSVRGGPSWADSDAFTIEAKAAGVTHDTLSGPMLRALLADRFQLKAHRATEQQSMYALTLGKGPLKIKPTASDECFVLEPGKPAPAHADGVWACGGAGGKWGHLNATGVMFGDAGDASQSALAGTRVVDMLWRVLLRVVVDKTGLTGRYSFTLDFTPDDRTPGAHGSCNGDQPCIDRLTARGISDAPPATFSSSKTIFQALDDLGLHLALTKAPSDFIVIDHAERPKIDASFTRLPAARGAR